MKYPIELSETEHQDLTRLTRTGSVAAQSVSRASILLLSDTRMGYGDAQICLTLGLALSTVEKTRRKYREHGLERAIYRAARVDKGIPHKLDGRVEAHTTAIACGELPLGRARWTLTMIADRLVELEVVDCISRASVHAILKKTRCSPIG